MSLLGGKIEKTETLMFQISDTQSKLKVILTYYSPHFFTIGHNIISGHLKGKCDGSYIMSVCLSIYLVLYLCMAPLMVLV